MQTTWLVCYDISDDKMRYQARQVLLNYGNSVQYSVFECTLTAQTQARLTTELYAVIAAADNIRWYPLCRNCKRQIQTLGQSTLPVNTDYYIS